MTDKQIIIDGVDVHWCEHYTGNIGYLTDKNWTCRAKIQGTKCEDWSNCYFKRWQRKEQECETLASQLDFEVQKKECLEQECEELKKELYYWVNGEYCDNECNVVKELDLLKAENKRFKETLDELFKTQYTLADNNKKLRQCLVEIKEIAITGLEGFCPKCSRKECEDNNCIETAIRDILQKISECEVEE